MASFPGNKILIVFEIFNTMSIDRYHNKFLRTLLIKIRQQRTCSLILNLEWWIYRGIFHLFPNKQCPLCMVQYKRFENKVRKREIAHDEQFLLFLPCFLPYWRTFCHYNEFKIVACNVYQFSGIKTFVYWENVKYGKRVSRCKCLPFFFFYFATNRSFPHDISSILNYFLQTFTKTCTNVT